MDCLHEKKAALISRLQALGHVAVAYSAGVDSTFLLKAAQEALGENTIAVTACSRLLPARERREAEAFCTAEGIRHLIVEIDPFLIDGFRKNPPNRCYLCKKHLLSALLRAAAAHGFSALIEGSNADDAGDYRPGMAAIAELGVQSPLRDAGLTKREIRLLSGEMGLPTWEKPPSACLATRFVYGEPITAEKLSMVDRAEQRLLDLGFRQVRVRVHGDLARIEVEAHELERIVRPEVAGPLEEYLRGLGFLYVTLDLGGYQTGSMNRVLR